MGTGFQILPTRESVAIEEYLAKMSEAWKPGKGGHVQMATPEHWGGAVEIAAFVRNFA